MNKRLSAILSSFLIIPLVQTSAVSLSTQLKGKILLQTESHGEAWYVRPDDGKRYYLKDGATAYAALRAFGLGVSNANIAKIPVGLEPRFQDTDTDADGLPDQLEDGLGTKKDNPDSDGDSYSDGQEIQSGYNPLGTNKLSFDTKLVSQLKGKILLQTESHGEAWYVRPDDGKRYYMKNGEAAYQIMRYLSLGITNANLNTIPVGTITGVVIPPTPGPEPLPITADAYRNYAIAVCYARANVSAIETFPSGLVRDDFQSAVNDVMQTCDEFSTTEINDIASLLTTDNDKDGVNALLEQYFGTLDTKADTDGDSVSDLQEIQLTTSEYTWNTTSDQIKYEGLLSSPAWQTVTLNTRIDGFTMIDTQVTALGNPVALKQQKDAGCFNTTKTTGYLRFEGPTDCATGYWLQATGTKSSLRIATPALLKSNFGPVSSPAEAISFVAAVAPGLETESNGVPKARVLTLTDGYLVQVQVIETLGFAHPAQKVIYRVSTDGTITGIAIQQVE